MKLVPPALRVRLAAGEPAYGLLDRLALRHGATSSVVFLHQLPRLSTAPSVFLSWVRAGWATNEVASLARISPDRLADSTFVRGNYKVPNSRADLRLRKGLWNGSGRVCPACVGEDLKTRPGPEACRPYRRLWWDHAFIRTCPKHVIPLLAKCPGCGNALGAATVSPRHCHCGFDVMEHSPIRLPGAEVEADAYLISRIMGTAMPGHPLLDSMSLDVAASSFIKVGAAAVWGAKPPTMKVVSQGELVTVACKGYEALRGDGAGLTPILDRLAAARTGVSVPKTSSYYGRLHEWLSITSDTSLDGIRDIVARHAAFTFPRSSLAGLYGRNDLPWERITFGAAARLWGLQDRAALNVARLAGVCMSRQKRMEEITRAECEAVQEWLSSHVNSEGAKALLGVSDKVFYRLLSTGLIERLSTSPSKTYSYYNRKALGDLVSCAGRSAPALDGCPPGCVTVVKASRPFQSTADLIRALLDERIKPVGALASKTGLAAIVVRSTDASDIASNADHGMISGVEAAAMLGMSTTETITKAIAHGLLSAAPGTKAKKAGRQLSRADVVQFDKDYVLENRLRKDFGLSKQKANSILRAAGVVPIFRGQSRGTLYVRAEAEPVLQKCVDGVEGVPCLVAPLVGRDADPSGPAARSVRRTYTAEFRAEAVLRLNRSGEGLVKVAGELGVGISVLCRWRRRQALAGSAEALAVLSAERLSARLARNARRRLAGAAEVTRKAATVASWRVQVHPTDINKPSSSKDDPGERH